MSEYVNTDTGETAVFTHTTTLDQGERESTPDVAGLPTHDCAGSGDLGIGYCQPPAYWCTQHGMIEAEDGSCVPLDYYDTPAEDDPSWDCNTMGNMTCGTTTTMPLSSYQEPKLPVTGAEGVLLLVPMSIALISFGFALIRSTRPTKKAGPTS